MAKRLDADIRELAETMQQRRREANKRVADQEIMGMRFMSDEDVVAAAYRNWDRIKVVGGTLTDLADAHVYALEMLRRQADQE